MLTLQRTQFCLKAVTVMATAFFVLWTLIEGLSR
jgi:hypothetical protein